MSCSSIYKGNKNFTGSDLPILLNDRRQWKVLQTKIHEERDVAARLKLGRTNVYVPMMQNNVYTFGKLKLRVQPLFPQYIFARFDMDEMYPKIRWMSGVKGVLCFNGKPAVVTDEVISILKRQENRQGVISRIKSFKTNQRVVVQYGVLKDLEGLFLRELSGPDRVLVLMNILGVSTHVQLNPAMLKPAG